MTATFKKDDLVFAITDAGRAITARFQEQRTGKRAHRAILKDEDDELIEVDLETVELV